MQERKKNELNLPPKYQEAINLTKFFKLLLHFLGFLTKIGFCGNKTQSLITHLKKIDEQQKDIYFVLRHFNEIFQDLGWIISESSHHSTLKNAIVHAQKGEINEAEGLLTACYEGQNLDFLVTRILLIDAFKHRKSLISEAASLCHEGRHLAAIPLLLIIADGVGQDYFGKAIFSDGTNLTEIDALAGHVSNITAVTSLFTKTRRKLNNQEITLPYRNGIMHGRDVNYGNRLVAAKSWAYISCVADIIHARENRLLEPSRKKLSLVQSLQKYKETKTQSKLVENWQARPIIEPKWTLSNPYNFDIFTPEAVLAEFLMAWKSRNYGSMGEKTIYFDNRSIAKRAGQIRKSIENIQLLGAKIIQIKDIAGAITEVDCELTLQAIEVITEKLTFRMVYGDEYSSPLLRGHKNGSWKVVPNYLGWHFMTNIRK